MSHNDWYSSEVFRGDQLGRTIGYPTLNLKSSVLPPDTKQGVYSSRVKIGEKEYLGALYFGPRLVLNETKIVLEIYILDFDQEIYGERVEFQLGKYIRGIMDFDSLEALKLQLKSDVERIQEVLSWPVEEKG